MASPAGAPPGIPEPQQQRTGFAGEAMRLLGSLGKHFQALAGLAGAEGREAAALYVRIVVALGTALVLLLFGYVFLLLFAAFALAALAHVAWLWIALGFAVLHLLGAAGFALYVKSRFRTPVFQATAEEIRKDIAALRGSPE